MQLMINMNVSNNMKVSKTDKNWTAAGHSPGPHRGTSSAPQTTSWCRGGATTSPSPKL